MNYAMTTYARERTVQGGPDPLTIPHTFIPKPSTSLQHGGLHSKRYSDGDGDGEDKVDEKEDDRKSDGRCGDTANSNITSCCVWARKRDIHSISVRS